MHRPSWGPTVPVPALPIVDARFPAEIAPGVFILPDKRIPLVPNIGIIVGQDSVLVVDCGLGPESGESVIKLAPSACAGPERRADGDARPPGSMALARKRSSRMRAIYYNAAQRDYFARSGATLLDGFRAVLSPERRSLLDGVIFTPPDQTYDGDHAMLDLGGRRVEFRTWGTAAQPR